jgi:ABC-type multidrug transport system permease subunit
MFIGVGYDESGFPWWTWVMLATSPALMGIGARFVPATRPRMQFCVVVAMPAALALSAVTCAVLVSGVLTRKAVPSSSSDPYSSAVEGIGSTQRVTITQDVSATQP